MRRCWSRVGLLLAAGFCVLVLGSRGASGGAYVGADGKIAYAVPGTGIVIANADGSNPAPVTGTAAGDVDPSWNGEGTAIVFERSGTIEKFTLGGSIVSTGLTGTDPSFSPDGTKIAYVNADNIWVASADGSGAQNVTNSGAPSEAPAWSPDGTKIAFARGTSGHSIFVMNADGSGQTQLTSGSADDTHPTWSPNGAAIAFDSTRDGPTPAHQIYTVPAAGGNVTRLTNTSEDDQEPAYSPDGTRILFAQQSGSTGVYSISAGGGSGTQVVATAIDSPPDEQPLVVAGTPTISGGTVGGATLVADPGSWVGVDITFHSQWRRCDSNGGCVDVGTPDSPSYSLGPADIGYRLEIVVTGSNGASSATATSALTATIAGGPGPVNTVLPSIALPTGFDAPQIGMSVSATTGTWTGLGTITYKYQWTKCDDTVASKPCYDIPGATSSFFLATADLAHWDLSVTVTATNDEGSTYVRARPTKPVSGEAPSNHGSPRVTGENYVGSTLVSDTGLWRGLLPITYTYQWKRCDPFGNLESCAAIAGATTNTYVLRDADLNLTIRVFVTATNAIAAVTQFSNHTFPTLPMRHFAPSSFDPPFVTGTARPGFLLRTTLGSWGGDMPQRYAYRWLRCDATGGRCVAIRRATKDRYTVSRADLGSTIEASVTATNAYGTFTATSDPTDPVSASPKLPRGRRVVGTSHSDYIAGGGGNDTLLGRGGNDTIKGGNGRDFIDGGAGNDVLDGGPMADVILGGPGSDTIFAADGTPDTVDCGPGQDRAVVDQSDKVRNCEVVTYGQPAGARNGNGNSGNSG